MATNLIIVICPHCEAGIEVVQVNCAIFRHGVFKSNGEQIPPHAGRHDCERWSINNEIIGCGKPFQIVKETNNDYVAIKCEYI